MAKINQVDLQSMPADEQARKKKIIDDLVLELEGPKDGVTTPLALPGGLIPKNMVDPYAEVRTVLFDERRNVRQAVNRIIDTIKKSTTDALTGLNNKRAFMSALPKAVERANKVGKNVHLVMIDLDHFKRVNDKYGHAAGDAVLVQLAELLKKNNEETPFRWGGEEFALIVDSENNDSVKDLCENLRKAIEQHEFLLPGGKVLHMTASIGYGSVALNRGDFANETEVSDDEEKTDEQKQADLILKLVDKALYAAKAGGRNTVVEVGGEKYNNYLSSVSSTEYPVSELDDKNIIPQDDTTGNKPENRVYL